MGWNVTASKHMTFVGICGNVVRVQSICRAHWNISRNISRFESRDVSYLARAS